MKVTEEEKELVYQTLLPYKYYTYCMEVLPKKNDVRTVQPKMRLKLLLLLCMEYILYSFPHIRFLKTVTLTQILINTFLKQWAFMLSVNVIVDIQLMTSPTAVRDITACRVVRW